MLTRTKFTRRSIETLTIDHSTWLKIFKHFEAGMKLLKQIYYEPPKKITRKKTKTTPSFSELIAKFPQEWQDNRLFYKALRHFYISRKNNKKGIFSDHAMDLLQHKLLKFSIEVSTAALMQSAEEDWTGVFPESVKANFSTVKADTKTPQEILELSFNGKSKTAFANIFEPALKLSPNTSPSLLARKICDLYIECCKKQQRPANYEHNGRWGMIPEPHIMLKEYVSWLKDEKRFPDVHISAFEINSKLFYQWTKYRNSRLTLDMFTGREVDY